MFHQEGCFFVLEPALNRAVTLPNRNPIKWCIFVRTVWWKILTSDLDFIPRNDVKFKRYQQLKFHFKYYQKNSMNFNTQRSAATNYLNCKNALLVTGSKLGNLISYCQVLCWIVLKLTAIIIIRRRRRNISTPVQALKIRLKSWIVYIFTFCIFQ